MSFLKSLSDIFKGKVVPTVKPVVVRPKVDRAALAQAQAQAQAEARTKAEAEAREIVLEAKSEALKLKQQAEAELRKALDKVANQRQQIFKQQAELDKKVAVDAERQKQLQMQEQSNKDRLKTLTQKQEEIQVQLQKLARLTPKEAQKIILDKTDKDLTEEIALRIKQAETKIEAKSDQLAKEILVDAMRRGATDYVAEFTVSTVKLPDEEMKGRVIGREGRNIRAFEKATGVDVDLDEEGVIQLSSYDSVRREIARVALERLMSDGRIQPARIEEVVRRTKEEIDRTIYKSGEDLCHRVKVFNLPREIVAMLGRFKYRFSYGQNLVTHTLEVTKIGVQLAAEVGADVNVIRLACLLHDIGKVITDEEGTHVELGVKLLKRHGIPKQVIDCVAEHHEDRPFSSVESTLVYIADAISGARPGARYEDFQEYVQRMENLEEIAKSFKGVEKVFAIQAGREVRVMVNPQDLNDAAVTKLTKDITKKIEKEIKAFPGQIKVVAIREFRSEATAG